MPEHVSCWGVALATGTGAAVAFMQNDLAGATLLRKEQRVFLVVLVALSRTAVLCIAYLPTVRKRNCWIACGWGDTA